MHLMKDRFRPEPLLGFLLLSAVLVFVAGCSSKPGQTASGNAASAGEGFTLRIGHQRADALNLLQVRGDLDKRLAAQHIKVEWVNFQAGAPLLEALNVGSLDLGSTGESPPIFAQAAGSPLVYLANIPLTSDAGKGQALLLPRNSPIHSVAELKGKKIAVTKASGAHNFLVQIIQKAGLQFSDIQPVYMTPPDARIAFESGSVDGWAIWEPYLTVAQQKSQARVLADARDVISPGSFYLATRKIAQEHPDVLKIVLEEIKRAGLWATEHPHEAAEQLAQSTGIDAATLESLQRRTYQGSNAGGIRPIDETIISQQQTVADNYFHIGLLPRKVDVRGAMLSPQEYARLTPAVTETARTAR